MLIDRRPLLGASLLAAFITACLGWLFHGAGAPVPLWGYPVVFAVFAFWIYGVGCLLMESGPRFRARSVDISIES